MHRRAARVLGASARHTRSHCPPGVSPTPPGRCRSSSDAAPAEGPHPLPAPLTLRLRTGEELLRAPVVLRALHQVQDVQQVLVGARMRMSSSSSRAKP